MLTNIRDTDHSMYSQKVPDVLVSVGGGGRGETPSAAYQERTPQAECGMNRDNVCYLLQSVFCVQFKVKVLGNLG